MYNSLLLIFIKYVQLGIIFHERNKTNIIFYEKIVYDFFIWSIKENNNIERRLKTNIIFP